MSSIKNFGVAGVSSDVQFGKGGPRLIQTSGVFKAMDSAGTTPVRLQVANASTSFDSVNLSFLNIELVKLQTAAGLSNASAYAANTFTTYLTSVTNLKLADEALDRAVSAMQTELDATQTGSGLNTNGTFSANGTGNYVSGATSLKSATNLLDTALKNISLELDTTQTGAGLNSTGTYTANGTGNYISGATTLKSADNLLDTALKNVQTELDLTQASVGVQSSGALPSWSGVNYVGSANTVLQAVTTLDTQLKTLSDTVTGLGSALNYVGTLAGGGTSPSAYDLTTLPANQQNTGDYFKVSSGGYFKVGSGGTPFYANANDGLVKNSSSGWDIIDNTDSVVSGTTGRITVTGSTDQGFILDIDSTYVGQNTITTVGTIATGTWSASTIATSKGGTGQTSYAQGDLLVGNGSSGLSKLTKGSAKQYLRVDAAGTTLEYAALAGTDVSFSGGGITANTVSGAISEVKATTNAVVTATGLNANGTYTANVSANYISGATTLKDADNKLDAAVKALSLSVASMTGTEIVSVNTYQSVKVTNTATEFYGNVASVKTLVGQIVESSSTNSYFSIDTGTAAKIKMQTLSGAAADVDFVIDPKGAGVVDVSTSRITNVSDPTGSGDAMNLSFTNANYTRRKAVDITETASNFTIGVIAGTVVRVMINISVAWGGGSTLNVGTSVSNGLLVQPTDIDLTQVGVYVVDVITDVNATVIAYVTGSGSGTGKVIVEYLSS